MKEPKDPVTWRLDRQSQKAPDERAPQRCRGGHAFDLFATNPSPRVLKVEPVSHQLLTHPIERPLDRLVTNARCLVHTHPKRSSRTEVHRISYCSVMVANPTHPDLLLPREILLKLTEVEVWRFFPRDG